MLDTGATHNFITRSEAIRLGMRYSGKSGTLKTVNTAAKPIWGIAHDVRTTIGDWSGKLKFTVVDMDDFELVLGMDFFKTTQAVPIPQLKSLLIPGEKPCLVKTSLASESEAKEKGLYLAAMQLRGEVSPRTSKTAQPMGKALVQKKGRVGHYYSATEFNKGDILKESALPGHLRFLWVQEKRLVRVREGPIRIIKRFGRKGYKVEPLGR